MSWPDAEPFDEVGSTDNYPGIDLAPAALEIVGGDFADGSWPDPDNEIVVEAGGALSDTQVPLPLVTGTADAYGPFQLDNPWPKMRITVPTDDGLGVDETYAGQYTGIVTYTINEYPAP